MKNIVILGGNYAGVSTAHRILKHAAGTAPFKITIVCPNTHFYWSMASPRGVIPGLLTDEQLFQEIKPGFAQYPADRVEIIHASAESLNVEKKTVRISDSSGSRTITYDFLILATGARAGGDMPFKILDSVEATKEALHKFQNRVKTAKSIVVAGAGLTGVEVAGELAYIYGAEKEVTLISSRPTVLEGSPESVSKVAQNELHKIGVKLKLEQRVMGSTAIPNGQQNITLSSGDKLTADMYIPAFGLIPNSSYVPTQFLNASGYVVVDDYLKVEGAEDVWAVGDVSAIEPPQFKVTDAQSAHLAKNIVSILSSRPPLPYKKGTVFKGCSVGRKSGTGHFGTWRIPSFVIVMARKNLFMDNLKPTVDGSLF